MCVYVHTHLYAGCWRLHRRTEPTVTSVSPSRPPPLTHQTAAVDIQEPLAEPESGAQRTRHVCVCESVCVTTWGPGSDRPRVMMSFMASCLQLQPRACGRTTELGLCTVYAVSAVISPSKKLSDTQGPRATLPRWRPIMATMVRKRSTSCYRLGQSPETSAYRRML